MSDPAEGLRPDALASFWGWWAATKDRIAAAIADQSLGGSPLVQEISNAVHALHPGFAWELGRGQSARHNLTLSPEGNLALRRLTGQWLASAPPADQTWEYSASRQPSEVMGLEIAGRRFAPEDFRVVFAYDQQRERFDVRLHHPHFNTLDGNVALQVVFLTLDQVLGEDGVERWMGSVEPSRSSPPGATRLSELRSAIGEAAKTATGDRFKLGEGEARDGAPVLISVKEALKQIDHLDHVFHLDVVIPLRQPDANGFPGPDESGHLDRAEDDLDRALGENAVHVGRATRAGRREIHMFVRDPAAASAAVTRWIGALQPSTASHTIAYDPGWSTAKHGIYSMLAPRRG